MAALPAYDVNFRVANVDLKALATAFEPTFNSQAIVTKISKLAFERGLLLEAVARSDGNKFCNLGHTHAALASLHGDGPADATQRWAARADVSAARVARVSRSAHARA